VIFDKKNGLGPLGVNSPNLGKKNSKLWLEITTPYKLDMGPWSGMGGPISTSIKPSSLLRTLSHKHCPW